jgi:uncharacterized membrane protein
MESYQVNSGDHFPEAVAYGLFSNKKSVQRQTMPTVVFESDMVKTGLTAVTFPTIKGANKMLDSLVVDNLIEPINALIIEKNRRGELKVKKSIKQTENAPKCSELCFVVALLLRGSVAADLLGGAASTLLANPIELGIAQEKIDEIVEDMVTGSSVLFVLDHPSLKQVVPPNLSQTNGKRYDFSMMEKVMQKVQIMSSTLDYYWLEA